MKPSILLCLFCLLCSRPAASAILLEDAFDYPDGILTEVSQGRWATHGGTSNQIQVSAGQIVLSQTQSEDVNAPLAGGPYRGPVLYAGFAVKATALPTGEGAYFAHFKDGTSTGFRGRVYATTNSAAAGKWRAGVATGAGAPVWITTDLDPATEYNVVLRYDTGTPGSTLWINPVSENSAQDRADASDSATALSIASFAFRESLASGAGMGTLRIDRLRVGTSFIDVIDNFDPRRDPPALSAIADQSVPANTSTPAVPFVIRDQQTAADNLHLRAASDHPELVAVSGVVFGGGGSNRPRILRLFPLFYATPWN